MAETAYTNSRYPTSYSTLIQHMAVSTTVWPLKLLPVLSDYFHNGGRHHLGFSKFRNVKGGRVKRSMCITVPNFVAIGQTVAEIWRFLELSKMAAVCHIGLVIRMFGPLTKGICWSLYCANFSWNRCTSFDKMHVLISCELGLKTPIHARKLGSSLKRGSWVPT